MQFQFDSRVAAREQRQGCNKAMPCQRRGGADFDRAVQRFGLLRGLGLGHLQFTQDSLATVVEAQTRIGGADSARCAIE